MKDLALEKWKVGWTRWGWGLESNCRWTNGLHKGLRVDESRVALSRGWQESREE